MAEHGHTLCGEVNSKNSMGGYTGYEKFITDDTGYVAIVEGSGTMAEVNMDIWRKFCTPKIKAPKKPKFDPHDGRTWDFNPYDDTYPPHF